MMLLHSGLLRTGDVWLLSCLPYFFDCSLKFLNRNLTSYDTRGDLRCAAGAGIWKLPRLLPRTPPSFYPRTSPGCSIMIRSCAAMFYYYYRRQLEWICERNRNHVARDWKWEGRSYFQVSQGLEAGYVAVKYNANTFKARRCRSSFLDLLFIHKLFSTLVSNT
jgi:hypothetical protein